MRTQGKIQQSIIECAERLRYDQSVLLTTTNTKLIERYIGELKKQGINCQYEPYYHYPRVRIIYDFDGEAIGTQIEPRKQIGYLITRKK